MPHSIKRNTIVLFLASFLSICGTNSPWAESRWHLQRIVQRDRLTAQQVATGSAAFDLRSIPTQLVNVYVIDSGILIGHEEFVNTKAIYGKNIRNPERIPTDCDGHGTHVAATAVGAKSGVASNARAISVRILSCGGRGSCSNVLHALEWVARDSSYRRRRFKERSVAVMSIGSRSNDCAPTVDASKVLWDSGVFIAAAAGNERGDACQMYPARSPSTVAVGAFDIEDKMYYRNNYGPCVDIFAPGVKVLAGWGVNSTTEMKRKSGSSMATPIVAGLAAIILGVAPSFTSNDVKNVILSSATRGRLYEPTGEALLLGSPNEMVYAPWSRLFDELDMDDAEANGNDKHTNQVTPFTLNDSYWNSSTTFAALTMTLHPITRPAMFYSVCRLKRSISRVSDIRESAILARLRAGGRHATDGLEPRIVRLVFYIPMVPSQIRTYKDRILRAAINGELQERSNETISFEHSVQSTLRVNITVPAPLARIPEKAWVLTKGDTIRVWINVALTCFGCVLAVVFLFSGVLMVRRSLKNLMDDRPDAP